MRHTPAALFLVLLACPACRTYDSPPFTDAEKLGDQTFEVVTLRDVPYDTAPDAAPERHRLDLYLPRGLTDYPVVVFVHGGAWTVGSKTCCGWYSAVGEFLARHGVGAVLPNYRLSPGVKHPEHVKDVARAFAWTKAHVAEHGGRPDRLFLAGHSAGGHLAALLATDERYLKAEGLSTEDVRGVIGVSGVYRIPEGRLHVTLGGTGGDAFHLDAFFPLRSPTAPADGPRLVSAGLPVSVNFFGPAFGNDPGARADASPINHVRAGLPPMLLFCADNELPTLEESAEEFERALRGAGSEARLLKVKGRNHHSIIFCATEASDPVGGAILAFVRRRGM